MSDLSNDITALLHPLPGALPANGDDTGRQMELHDEDPLLHALSDQARIKQEAEHKIRLLVAYAREFVAPRPYTLETLASAMRTSPSAVRGAYDHRDVEAVASTTGRRSTVTQTPAEDAVLERLIAELENRTAGPGREHVTGVAAALREQGWTPYPPVPRTPNPKYARRYLRWERRWPHGTVISLYQEPASFLGVHAKMAADDPRSFSETYGINTDGENVTAADIAASLAAYADRVTRYDAERQANL